MLSRKLLGHVMVAIGAICLSTLLISGRVHAQMGACAPADPTVKFSLCQLGNCNDLLSIVNAPACTFAGCMGDCDFSTSAQVLHWCNAMGATSCCDVCIIETPLIPQQCNGLCTNNAGIGCLSSIYNMCYLT